MKIPNHHILVLMNKMRLLYFLRIADYYYERNEIIPYNASNHECEKIGDSKLNEIEHATNIL